MDLLTKPPSTLPGNAQQEPGQGVVFKSNTMYAGLNDDHDDPCFMCRGNCKNCEYNTQEDLFNTLAGITKPDRLQQAINNIEFAAMRIENITKTL